MLFGSDETLGIRLELDTHRSKHPWMFGTFGLSLGGHALSAPDTRVTLNHTLTELACWEEGRGKRTHDALARSDSVTAFLSLEIERYGDEHLKGIIPPLFSAIDVPNRQCFELTPMDGVDLYKIYAIDGADFTRIVFRHENGWVQECRVRRAEFDETMASALATLRSWWIEIG